jgi:DUF971 family protein
VTGRSAFGRSTRQRSGGPPPGATLKRPAVRRGAGVRSGGGPSISVRSHAVPANPKPRSIEVIGEAILAVVWEDGHESLLRGAALRENCPCADCRTGRLRAGGEAVPRPGGALVMAPPRLIGAEWVGRYAVRLHWSDGHAAGIFEFPLLRSLCDCPDCRMHNRLGE